MKRSTEDYVREDEVDCCPANITSPDGCPADIIDPDGCPAHIIDPDSCPADIIGPDEIESLTITGVGKDTVKKFVDSIRSSQREYEVVQIAPEAELLKEPLEEGKCRLEFDSTMFTLKITQNDLYRKYKYEEYLDSVDMNSLSLSKQHGDEKISDGVMGSVIFVMCKNHANYMKAMAKICTHIGLHKNKRMTDDGDCVKALLGSHKIRAIFEMMPQISERFDNEELTIIQSFDDGTHVLENTTHCPKMEKK
jgi:hypothetical protein